MSRFRDAGKQLFLCSNSDFNYVSSGLKYLLGEDWRDFFDVMIVSAGKPRYVQAGIVQCSQGNQSHHGHVDTLSLLYVGSSQAKDPFVKSINQLERFAGRQSQSWRKARSILMGPCMH